MQKQSSTTARPSWWDGQYDSTWERVKEALKRDWEQTKRDFGKRGPDLNQDVDDTLRQAAGKQPIPPSTATPNASDEGRDYSEEAVRYGYGAGLADVYRTHTAWSDRLETDLQREWTDLKVGRPWNEVRTGVRHGFEHARSSSRDRA